MSEAGPPCPPRVPERQCVACRTLVPRDRLIRVVRPPEGDVTLDLEQRRQGRGAYVCRTPECIGQALKRGGFQRALRRPLAKELLETIAEMADASNRMPS